MKKTKSVLLTTPYILWMVVIEFLPDMWQIFLRNRRSGIEYGNFCHIIFLGDLDLDHLLTIDMVQCIVDIVPDNLLNLKLICPDINRVLVAENHLCFFLLDQNIQTLQDTRNQ